MLLSSKNAIPIIIMFLSSTSIHSILKLSQGQHGFTDSITPVKVSLLPLLMTLLYVLTQVLRLTPYSLKVPHQHLFVKLIYYGIQETLLKTSN